MDRASPSGGEGGRFESSISRDMIVLASGSARRKAILQALGIDFIAQTPICDENVDPLLPIEKIPGFLSEKKIISVKDRLVPAAEKAKFIVAADTIVAFEGKYYGKPANRNEARNLLRMWSGKNHGVLSAISVYNRSTLQMSTHTVKNDITFVKLTDREIESYLDTNEWIGVAGAYRIQGRAAFFVKKIIGNWTAAVGLPVAELYTILHQQGYNLL